MSTLYSIDNPSHQQESIMTTAVAQLQRTDTAVTYYAERTVATGWELWSDGISRIRDYRLRNKL